MDLANQLLNKILGVLPTSPFRGWIDSLSYNDSFFTAIQYINWFLPISEFLKIFLIYLGVVSVYYVYQCALRLVHIID